MSLSLTTQLRGPVCFAGISGPLTLSPVLSRVTQELRDILLRNGASGVVIDLGEVSDVDSAGLGELVNIYKIASDRRLGLALTGVSRRVHDMLTLTHLDALLPCYDTEADAESAIRRSL